jgi:hypothetical protein
MASPSASALFSSARSATTLPEMARTAPRSVKALSQAMAASGRSDWTASTDRSKLRRAKGMILRHAGYLPGGIPDVPIMMARKASSKEPSKKQLRAQKKFIADGGPMERWQAFRKANPGIGPKELSVMWKAQGLSTRKTPREPRRASHAGEAMRYLRLVEAAEKAKKPYKWHSSRSGPGAYSRHSHVKLGDLQFMGRPYGTMFEQDGVLHGSGRMYG